MTREQVLTEALVLVSDAQDLNELDQIRVRYLGKKGEFTQQMKALGKLDAEQRPIVGQAINHSKEQFQTALESRKNVLQSERLAQRLNQEKIDVSLPGRCQSVGGIHPVTITLRRITEIFKGVGFEVVEGPEIEDDYHNFEALNIPAHHPIFLTR